jgi:hypothetical protein
MSLVLACPRCREPVERVGKGARCPVHGTIPALWLPQEPSYDEFVEHLRVAGDFPTYLPWPMSPGWAVTEFGVVTARSGRPMATITCCSGTSELDGPVDAFVVAEEAGVGLGARCAGLISDDPGSELGEGPPPIRVRIGSQAVPLWPVSTSGSGRWLWLALRPASAMLLLRDDWILRDVSGVGAPLLEMPFGGPRPSW